MATLRRNACDGHGGGARPVDANTSNTGTANDTANDNEMSHANVATALHVRSDGRQTSCCESLHLAATATATASFHVVSNIHIAAQPTNVDTSVDRNVDEMIIVNQQRQLQQTQLQQTRTAPSRRSRPSPSTKRQQRATALVTRLIRAVLLLCMLISHTTAAAAPGAASLTSPSAISTQVAQGREIQQRVFENVDHFMNAPVLATKLTNYAYEVGEFDHGMQPQDRDRVMSQFYVQAISMELKVYYGLETGTTTIITDDVTGFTYRESGNSGYDLDDPRMAHYRDACVNRDTGAVELCEMSEGAKYVSCDTDDCDAVFPCSSDDDNGVDEAGSSNSQIDCGNTTTASENAAECSNQDKPTQRWCRKYSIVKAEAGQKLGFVPRSYSCLNSLGRLTQEPGTAIYRDKNNPDIVHRDGTCVFRDGTPVTRVVSGPFAYCGNPLDPKFGFRSVSSDVSCDGAFIGVYRSRDYDPRMRSWYLTSKAKLRPFWSEPYVFFSSGNIGITWTEPLFGANAQGQSVFEGVLAVDYMLDQISNFLNEAYNDSDTRVVVYEAKAPYYMIGSSVSSVLSRKVLSEDPTQPCPADDSADCDVVRISVEELEGSESNNAIRNAHLDSLEAGFPTGTYVSTKASSVVDSKAFVAESILYEHPKANLQWRIMVITPVARSDNDTIKRGDQLFVPLLFVAGMGCAICLALAILLYQYRTTRAVIHADYRFTMAFIVACCATNMGMFTMLGENTDGMCMIRFWSFFLLSAMAFSPLIVKIYRMYRLVGATAAFQKVRITNLQAAMYAVPIPLGQAICLAIFSFVDPYSQRELLELESGVPVQRIICDFESDAFWITEFVLSVSLILVGCVLAYLTRNLDPRFGEAKQLMFSIYNLAFTGLIILVILYLVGVTQAAERVLLTISVFWGTILSSAAFVLPRIIQARQAIRNSRTSNATRIGNSSRMGNYAATIGMTRISGMPGVGQDYNNNNNNYINSSRSVENWNAGSSSALGTNKKEVHSNSERGRDDGGGSDDARLSQTLTSSSNGSMMHKVGLAPNGRTSVMLDGRLSELREREREDQFDDSSSSSVLRTGDDDEIDAAAAPSVSSDNTTSPSTSTPSGDDRNMHEAVNEAAISAAIASNHIGGGVVENDANAMFHNGDVLNSRESEPESVHFDGDRCSAYAVRDAEIGLFLQEHGDGEQEEVYS